MRISQALCIIFRKKEHDYEFLLLRRIPEKGGFWQPVSGGVEEEDESLLAAAYRELEEEACITKKDIVRVIEHVHSFEITRHYLTGEPMSPITENVLGFEVRPDVQINIDNNIYPEHDATQWVSYEEALELLKWDNNKDGFKKLHKILLT